MIIENPELFRAWLSTILEPLCDADPAALAKYVYALVKKGKPLEDIRASMVDQLDVFLQHETKPFVTLLFKTIDSKEYLTFKKTDKSEEQQSTLTEGPVDIEEIILSGKEEEEEPTIPSKEEQETVIQSTVVSEGSKSLDETEIVPDKLDDKTKKPDKEERFKLNRSKIKVDVSTSRPHRSRSRSWDRERGERTRRSRSRDRERGRDRTRPYRNNSPPRRYDRRYTRSPTSPGRRAFHNTETRSPKFSTRGRLRNRSPPSRGSRSPPSRSISRSRSRSFDRERKKSPYNRDGTPTQDSNHGDRISSTRQDCNRRCRDFDEKGYCMRGDLCQYDHGTDLVVLEDSALRHHVLTFDHGKPQPSIGPPLIPPPHVHDMQSIMPMVPPGVGPGPILGGPPPPPPHVMIRGPPPMLSRPPPDLEYNPDAPNLNSSMRWSKQPHMHINAPRIVQINQPARELISVPVYEQNREKKEGHNRCLHLRRVPVVLNNIAYLNNHFTKFGKITNIQVNFENNPESALITFSNPTEASSAFYSTEAVLNNRWIQVSWYKAKKQEPPTTNMDSSKSTWTAKDQTSPLQSRENNKMVTDSKLVTTNVVVNKPELLKKEKVMTNEERKAQTVEAIKKSQEMLEKKSLIKKKTDETRKEAFKLNSDLRKRSQTLLEKQLEQQKSLIKKLESGNFDEAQKKSLKETVKILQSSIDKLQKELITTVSVPLKRVMAAKRSREEIQKEILDLELDIITKQQEGGDVGALQKKLSLLKLEQSKFIKRPVSRPTGVMSRSSIVRNKMSLNRSLKKVVNNKTTPGSVVDHRPSKLLVSGYENDEKDQLLSHFRQYGEIVDYISDDSTPSIVLNFKTRKEAEDAMNKGKNFQDRLLTVTWFLNTIIQTRRRNSSVSGPTYHMHAGRQVLLSSSEPENDTDNVGDNDASSEIDANCESTDDLLLHDDDEDLEDEERSWRR